MKTRRITACFLAAALLLLGGCSRKAESVPAADSPALSSPAEPLDDAYRNWYEVFVWSFADSDGDGIGDLPGLTGKLDYIRSLGCNGIWLMPIMPSPSYHKYDVTDYCDVDPQYGTLEDLRRLLAEAHDRGIRVIIDLPVNHTSSEHPWFLSAAKGEEPYRDYYNWSDTAQGGYTQRGDAWYESRFVDTMPDLNLDNPAVREEIEGILRFWLTDVGVDGFRLDAVTSYYTGRVDENVAFLTWLGDTAHSIAPGCYLVGEAWDNLSAIARYAESSIDSFFLFPASQNEGWIARIVSSSNKKPGAQLGKYLTELETSLPANTIPAPFLENHDTGRTVGFTGRDDPVKTKLAGGLLCLMPGDVFLYYGQEIGMVGSGADPNKRIGMLWTTADETTEPPPGTTSVEYAYPSAAEQEADPDSLLNYYRAALDLRNRFPAIARGRSTVLPSGTDAVCLVTRDWEDESLLLAVNPSREEVRCALTGDAGGYPVLSAFLSATGGEAVLDDAGLLLPPGTFAVLTR